MQSNDNNKYDIPELESAASIIGKDSGKCREIVEECGGPSGPEPTRYGDWEKNGRCIDF